MKKEFPITTYYHKIKNKSELYVFFLKAATIINNILTHEKHLDVMYSKELLELQPFQHPYKKNFFLWKSIEKMYINITIPFFFCIIIKYGRIIRGKKYIFHKK